jgi:hypothetical protein
VKAAKGACVLGLIAAGLALLSRLVVLPWAEHVNAWVIPGDAWTPVRAARSVANGDVFHLYEPLAGRTGYPYPPLLPILLAPFVAIGDHFHLLGDVLLPHRRPGMFLLVGPAEAVIGTFPIVYVAGRAARGSVLRLQVLVFVVAAWAPVGWFHPEDTLACACLLAACIASDDDRDARVAGALVGVAVLTKQWALWPALPIVLAAAPRKRWLTAFYAFAIPGLVMAPFFLASHATYTSLAGTRATLQYGQPQLWLSAAFGHHQLANANLLRLAWGAVSVVVALRVRRTTPSIDMMIAGVGAVMLARLAFEPVLFGYYIVPALVCALVWCERHGRPIVMRAVTGSALCAFCLPHTFPEPVFFALLAFGLGFVCGPMLRPLFEPRTPHPHHSGVNDVLETACD